MPTEKNPNKSRVLRVTVTEQTEAYLEALIGTGYYSGKASSVGGAIIEEKVRQLINDGYLKKAAKARLEVEKALNSKAKSKNKTK